MAVGVTTNTTRAGGVGGTFPTGVQAYQLVAAGVKGTVEARLGPVKLYPFTDTGEPAGKVSLRIFVGDIGWKEEDDLGKVELLMSSCVDSDGTKIEDESVTLLQITKDSDGVHNPAGGVVITQYVPTGPQFSQDAIFLNNRMVHGIRLGHWQTLEHEHEHMQLCQRLELRLSLRSSAGHEYMLFDDVKLEKGSSSDHEGQVLGYTSFEQAVDVPGSSSSGSGGGSGGGSGSSMITNGCQYL
jgi:hypothetical protein